MAEAAQQFEAVPEVAADAERSGRDLVVMKFGGTSVADTEKIKDVARRLAAARESGRRVVGVLSAMGHTTDELISEFADELYTANAPLHVVALRTHLEKYAT